MFETFTHAALVLLLVVAFTLAAFLLTLDLK